MANNRMYLVHTPTGLAVFLGKRMAHGWYRNSISDTNAELTNLYEVLDEMDPPYANDQDNFKVIFELDTLDWNYGEIREDGLIQIVFKPAA